MVASWPPGTFSWLSHLLSAANNAALFEESKAIIDLVCVVAPHYQGRALMEGMVLFHQGRYREAAENMVEALRGDEHNTFKHFVLYVSLRELDNPEWTQHAQAVAQSPDHELSRRARADLGLPVEVAASDDMNCGVRAMGFDRMLVRV